MNNTKPRSFQSEAEAREHARKDHANKEVIILLSPHPENKNGNYFVEDGLTMIRSWETSLYEGLGRKA